MYKSVDIVDIIGSAIYLNNEKQSIKISELRKVVEDLEDQMSYLSVDISRRKMSWADDLSQRSFQVKGDEVVLPMNSELKHRFILNYFQLEQDLRKELERIVKNTITK